MRNAITTVTTTTLMTLSAVLLPSATSAQATAVPRVPAIDRSAGEGEVALVDTLGVTAVPAGRPPAVPVVSARNPRLTARERRAVDLSRRWIDTRDMPTLGDDGSVVFVFGATLPSVVCAPLQVCDLVLQPGEVVNDINVGDPVRWKLSPSTSGAGAGQTTHVIIKPTDAGLTTSLNITTDRREYVLKLVSRREDWMPLVSFSYPDDVEGEWAALRARQDAERARPGGSHGAPATLLTGEPLAALNFNFRLRGDRPRWRPLRVYADSAKTYIQLPPATANGEAPALVALGTDGKEQLVNYRLIGDRYVVDRVLDRAVLLVGVGRDQERVEIIREEDR